MKLKSRKRWLKWQNDRDKEMSRKVSIKVSLMNTMWKTICLKRMMKRKEQLVKSGSFEKELDLTLHLRMCS